MNEFISMSTTTGKAGF